MPAITAAKRVSTTTTIPLVATASFEFTENIKLKYIIVVPSLLLSVDLFDRLGASKRPKNANGVHTLCSKCVYANQQDKRRFGVIQLDFSATSFSTNSPNIEIRSCVAALFAVAHINRSHIKAIQITQISFERAIEVFRRISNKIETK